MTLGRLVGVLLVCIVVGLFFGKAPSSTVLEQGAVGATATSLKGLNNGEAAAPSVGPGERRISKANYGSQWPFTADEGILSCVTRRAGDMEAQGVFFRVGTTTYAVNGVAKQWSGPDVDVIWGTRAVSAPKSVVNRLPEQRRRDIFLTETGCPKRAEQAAEREFPGASTPAELKSSAVYEEKMQSQCMEQVRSQDRLTPAELDLIDAEGYALYWPPAKPVRVASIGPIIDDGLKLCSKK
jgi:hypothetical protein